MASGSGVGWVTRAQLIMNNNLKLTLEEVEPELGDDVDLFVNITYGYD